VKILRNIILFCISFGLAGCIAFKPDEANDPSPTLAPTFSMYNEPVTNIAQWWLEFNQPQLNSLIQQGLENNLSLQQTWARLRQADAIARQSASRLVPNLNLIVGTGYTEGNNTETITVANPDGGSYNMENYSLGLSSSYELDLWGRVRSQRNSVNSEVQASALDLQAASMTLSTRIASTWFNILSQHAQLVVLQQQLKTNQETLSLLDLRFQNSMATSLDVLQQRQVLANVESTIPLVEGHEATLLNELSVLLGEPPRKKWDLKMTDLPSLGKLPNTGIPADLLANRPDVHSAGLRLRSAEWQVSVARADRLPAISITARAQYESGDISVLFDNWIANLAGNLIGPIFDAGSRAAEVDRARAEVDGRLAAYRESVYNAVREVEDALIMEQKQQEHLDAIARQLQAAQQAFKESGERYLNGLIDYLPVQTALTTAQRLEVSEIQKKYDLLTYRLSLYRALGGNWMQSMPPKKMASTTE
jgi:NodT family efflux transporter outer membrane factor (OMF) lipoprotein